MTNREAIDTITGYFYQFDKTILEILKQEDDTSSICVEGIEDIDVITAGEKNAIQCKYYAKTEYIHSVIKDPIIMMLKHFAENIESGIKYHLYGHYKSGQEKLSELTIELLKTTFLTFKKMEKDEQGEKVQVTHLVYEELKLSDDDLNSFLKLLTVDIHAPSFEVQYQDIIGAIKDNLGVSDTEAELYHYNSALKVVRDLSMKQSREDRIITKIDFIKKIKVRDEIFDSWFIRRKGREKYIKSVKKQCLSNGLNMEAFDRFFLIDCCDYKGLFEIKEVVLLLAKKWSKISFRQNPKFCPSIYVHNLSSENIIELKNIMYLEGIFFLDAYPFKGANISPKHFYTEPSIENKIRFRIIDSIVDLEVLIADSKRTVEIYQFYKDMVFFDCDIIKNEKIKIEDISYIKDLTK
jgi:hypothetical protein